MNKGRLPRGSRIRIGISVVVVLVFAIGATAFALGGGRVQEGEIAGTYNVLTPDLEMQISVNADGTVGIERIPSAGGKFLGLGVQSLQELIDGLRWEKAEADASQEDEECYRLIFEGDVRNAIVPDDWERLQGADFDLNKWLRESRAVLTVPEGFPESVEGRWAFSFTPAEGIGDSILSGESRISFDLCGDGGVDLSFESSFGSESVSDVLRWTQEPGMSNGQTTVFFMADSDIGAVDIGSIAFTPFD